MFKITALVWLCCWKRRCTFQASDCDRNPIDTQLTLHDLESSATWIDCSVFHVLSGLLAFASNNIHRHQLLLVCRLYHIHMLTTYSTDSAHNFTSSTLSFGVHFEKVDLTSTDVGNAIDTDEQSIICYFIDQKTSTSV